MTTLEIVNIALVVLCAAIFGVSMYFRTRGKVTEAATELIALVEQSGLVGKEKMRLVVEKLADMIPPPFNTVFTPERLEQIAQEIFDNMKSYALEYLKQLEEKQKPSEEEPQE